MQPKGMIRFVIESRMENVGLMGGAVRGIADMLSFDRTGCFHLELCVVEAVNNTMKHAYHGEPGHVVEVEIRLFPDRIVFKIQDTGQSMLPSRVEPLRFEPRHLETVPERGMGRFIMNSLMDEVSYETVDGQNTLTLSKFLKKKPTPL